MDVEFLLALGELYPLPHTFLNAVIALDAEACYSDGAGRTGRFVYGSPLSVQQIYESREDSTSSKNLSRNIGPRAGRCWRPSIATPLWEQNQPPASDRLPGALLPTRPIKSAKSSSAFSRERPDAGRLSRPDRGARHGRKFPARHSLQWPNDLAVPGAHQLLGIIYDKSVHFKTRRAPHGQCQYESGVLIARQSHGSSSEHKNGAQLRGGAVRERTIRQPDFTGLRHRRKDPRPAGSSCLGRRCGHGRPHGFCRGRRRDFKLPTALVNPDSQLDEVVRGNCSTACLISSILLMAEK